MKEYYIEHEIITLLKNINFDDYSKDYQYFTIDEIEFHLWDFNYGKGCFGDKWIAKGKIEAENGIEALNIFRKNISKVINKIAFIGQAYIDFTNNSFLIIRDDIFLIRYSKERFPTGLTFGKQQINALHKLSINTDIPKEFFQYWKDAVNTTGYSAKLLLMICGVESIVNEKSTKNGKSCYQKDWELLELIYGKQLKIDLYGTPKSSSDGLRHKLVHGEYLDNNTGENYVEKIHLKVIKYFNKNIFNENLISENIISPQRHFFGNSEASNIAYRNKNLDNITLKLLIKDFENNTNLDYRNFPILGKEDISCF